MNLFTKDLNSLDDIYRFNLQDNNRTTNYDSGSPKIFLPRTFTQYQNSVYFKLDDFTGAETLPTSGFTGIKVNSESNTKLSWSIYDYVATNVNPSLVTASTACEYDVFLYISNMFQITNGDLIVVNSSM